jgi:hypothetical protein
MQQRPRAPARARTRAWRAGPPRRRARRLRLVARRTRGGAAAAPTRARPRSPRRSGTWPRTGRTASSGGAPSRLATCGVGASESRWLLIAEMPDRRSSQRRDVSSTGSDELAKSAGRPGSSSAAKRKSGSASARAAAAWISRSWPGPRPVGPTQLATNLARASAEARATCHSSPTSMPDSSRQTLRPASTSSRSSSVTAFDRLRDTKGRRRIRAPRSCSVVPLHTCALVSDRIARSHGRKQ